MDILKYHIDDTNYFSARYPKNIWGTNYRAGQGKTGPSRGTSYAKSQWAMLRLEYNAYQSSEAVKSFIEKMDVELGFSEKSTPAKSKINIDARASGPALAQATKAKLPPKLTKPSTPSLYDSAIDKFSRWLDIFSEKPEVHPLPKRNSLEVTVANPSNPQSDLKQSTREKPQNTVWKNTIEASILLASSSADLNAIFENIKTISGDNMKFQLTVSLLKAWESYVNKEIKANKRQHVAKEWQDWKNRNMKIIDISVQALTTIMDNIENLLEGSNQVTTQSGNTTPSAVVNPLPKPAPVRVKVNVPSAVVAPKVPISPTKESSAPPVKLTPDLEKIVGYVTAAGGFFKDAQAKNVVEILLPIFKDYSKSNFEEGKAQWELVRPNLIHKAIIATEVTIFIEKMNKLYKYTI